MRSSVILTALGIVAFSGAAPWSTTPLVGQETVAPPAAEAAPHAPDPQAELKAAADRINPLTAELEKLTDARAKAATDAERAALDQQRLALLLRRATTCLELLRADRAFTGADAEELERLEAAAVRDLTEPQQLERIAAEEGRTLFLTATPKKDLEEARRLDPKNWDALARLVELAVQSADYDAVERAQQLADELVSLAGAEPRRKAAALTWRAKAATDPASAVADCDAAIKLDKQNVEAYRLRGRLLAEDAPSKAERDFMMAMAIEPDHLLTRLQHTSLLLDAQDVDRTLTSFANSIKLLPHAAVLYQMRADVLRQLGRFDEALADANKVIELRPGQVMALLQRAIVRSDSGDVAAALDDIALAEKIDPEFSKTVFLKANLLTQHARAGEAADAVKAYAEKHSPDDARLWQQVASLYFAAKQFDDAAAALNRVLGPEPTTDPEHARLLGMRGGIQGFAGKYPEAVADFEACLKLAPDDTGALNGFAWMLATAHEESVRDGKRALALAERAAALTRRDDPHILSTLAAAHAELGDFAKALAIVDEALALADDEATRAACEKEQAAYRARKPFRDRRLKAADEAKEAPK